MKNKFMEEQVKNKKSFIEGRALKIILLSILGFITLIAMSVAPEEYKLGIAVMILFIGYIIIKITEKREINCSVVIISDILLGAICLPKIIEHGKERAETSAESVFSISGNLIGALGAIVLLFVLFKIIFSNIKINKEKLSKRLSTIIALFVALSIYFLTL